MTLLERVWYESAVPIFIEKFLLPVAAAVLVLVLGANPMNFDSTQRVTGSLAIVFVAWFVAHSLHLRNEAIRRGLVPSNAQAQTEVGAPFKSTYPKYSNRLGKPLAIIQSDFAYQGVYEHATVIWLHGEGMFYQLPNAGNRKWARFPDADESSGYIYRDEDLIPMFRQFQIPDGKLPPYAGVAHRWLKDPDMWQWIGWRDWDCYFHPGETFVQAFEHGRMMGPFAMSPQNGATRIFVLLDDDGTWTPEISTATAICREPPFRH